jgi:hypothetical protein
VGLAYVRQVRSTNWNSPIRTAGAQMQTFLTMSRSQVQARIS